MGRRHTVFAFGAGATALLSAACGGSSSGSVTSTSAPVRNATTANTIAVPVYNVVSSGLTQTQIAAVNKALDPVMPTGVDLTVDATGRLGYADTQALLVGTKTFTGTVPVLKTADDERADGVSSTGWDPVAVNALQPMSTAAMNSLVTNASASLKQGDSGALVKPGAVTLEMYSPSSRAITLKKQVATTGARTSRLGGYPLVGPGNSFDLLVGGRGRLAFANIQQRAYSVGASVQVPTGADAVARCRAALEKDRAGSTSGFTLVATLVYFAPAMSERLTTVEPALQCDGTAANGATLRSTFIRARLDVVAAVIRAGAAATFKAIVDNDTNGLELGTSYRAASARSPLAATAPSTQDYEDAMTAWGMDLKVDANDATPDRIFAATTDSAIGGADTVDMFWYTGHADGSGWQTDDGATVARNLRLGNTDLEWLVVAACGPFQDTAGGLAWQDRLTPMFEGLHLLLAYATTSSDVSGEGTSFANYSIIGAFPPRTADRASLVAAWIFTAMDNQSPSVRWAVGGAQSNSRSTVGDCLNCALADILPTEAGFSMWRLVGPS